MPELNNSDIVKNQYSTDRNLAARIMLHGKYSTNKYGFYNWLFDIYDFTGAGEILELGCGNGAQWDGRAEKLSPDKHLILSDFSEGMVETVRRKFESSRNVAARKIDIMSIPLPDDSFDIVIANHMLYHVPDLKIALDEVKRVLRPGGTFYASTIGSGGIRSYLHKALKQINPGIDAFNEEVSFTLQNGAELLYRHFSNVMKYEYEDSLQITETRDLIDWIKSSIADDKYSDEDLSDFYDYFESICRRDGAVTIIKETGLFVSKK